MGKKQEPDRREIELPDFSWKQHLSEMGPRVAYQGVFYYVDFEEYQELAGIEDLDEKNKRFVEMVEQGRLRAVE